MKVLATLVCIPCALFVTYLAISQDVENSPVELVVLHEGNIDQFVPAGKEVDAIYGDIVLRNKHLVAVIAQPISTRNANMTVRDVGGSLIDLTSRTGQSDQLSCYYPGRANPPYSSWTASTREVSAEQVTPELSLRSGTAAVTCVVEGNDQRARVETEYRLTTDARFLTVITRWKNTAQQSVDVRVGDRLRADGGKELMTKAPNGMTDLFWFADHYWDQAYGIRCVGRRIQCNSDSRTSDLSLFDDAEKDNVKLAPGEEVEVIREVACGANQLDVAAAFGMSDGQQFVPVSLVLWNAQRKPISEARLEIRRGDQLLGIGQTNARGEITLPLAPGGYTCKITRYGQLLREAEALLVADSLKQEGSIIVEDYNPGRVEFQVTDAERVGLPCKIDITGNEPTPTPDFGPETAEFAVRNLLYAPHGSAVAELAPGSYDLIISHGPEFSAVFTTLEVPPGERTQVRYSLSRVLDTAGWVSSDFHSHSSPSGDNTSSQLGRVLNLVCEHVEYAPCTEHNRISSYEPHIKSLKIENYLASTTGMELTGSPLPLNHQNVFPLHHHPHTQDGGAPVTDANPDVQVERIAKWDEGSEKLIQQNHPDLGWLVYDRNGDETPDSGHAGVMALLDVIEIHPIETVLSIGSDSGVTEENVGGNRIFRWLQMLNQGYRIPGVVNTDAHYNFHGSGSLRNWIQSSTDQPGEIDTLEMVHASEEGRVVMSNGPFLEAWCQAGDQKVTSGQELQAAGGKVNLQVKVQSPEWFDVDLVFVLVNGRPVPEHTYRRSTHADKFGDSPVRFEQNLELILDGDAHVIVCCGATESKLGPVFGPDAGTLTPAALTNPIYVDIDGNGFAANKDTLGLPLPVKGK